MLSRRRDRAAARLFFRRAIKKNGVPERIVIDKSGANLAGLQRINVGLKFSRTYQPIEILRVTEPDVPVEDRNEFRRTRAMHIDADQDAGLMQASRRYEPDEPLPPEWEEVLIRQADFMDELLDEDGTNGKIF